MVSRIFGISKPPAPAPAPTAAPDFGDIMDKNDKQQARIQAKIREINAELAAKKRDVASARTPATKKHLRNQMLHLLKRRKMYDQQLSRAYQQSMNVERVAFAIESANDTQRQVEHMKEATTHLQERVAALDIDEVADMQDDLADVLADQEEVTEMLGQSFGVGDDIDEGELDAELAALEEEGLGELEGEALARPELPMAPGAGVPAALPAAAAGGQAADPTAADPYGLPN